MKSKHLGKKLMVGLFIIGVVAVLFAFVSVFFDQAILVRKDTFYRAKLSDKIVALTFDDGPSPVWTPKILDELKKKDIKATFFMIGKHVQEYPEIARRVAQEGHEIGNHAFDHPVFIFSKADKVEKEILANEAIIKHITGQTTKLFRPPKAWLTKQEKREINDLGYKIVLWTLNSKDWAYFDDKYIIQYILKNIRPGDIILFHDSGGVFGIEGGDRSETVKTLPQLIDKLKARGYRFVTVTELMEMGKNNGKN